MAKKVTKAVEPEPVVEPEEEQVAELEEAGVPTSYTVTLGVKYPSAHTQYKMIEAHFSTTSADYQQAQDDALIGLDQAIINLCQAYDEPIPQEVMERCQPEAE